MGRNKIDFFKVLCNTNEPGVKARNGRIKTEHSVFETPVFMPVGTLGTVKAVENRELEEMNCEIILGNSYHLYLRPGTEILNKAGGHHRFMNWKHSLLTDSGGFQVFSLASLKKVTDEGVIFTSHLDGSKHIFTPEIVTEIQRAIGSDIMMPLDECLPYPSEKGVVEKSVKRTYEWEKKCMVAFTDSGPLYGHHQFLFSINQGSTCRDLRKQSIESLNELGFDGNAIGGLAVGEKPDEMYEVVDCCTDYLSAEKPRYLMGVGTPLDILECVERGVDMFDCVMPTRNARHGRLFTTYGELNMRNAKFAYDFRLADEECRTYTSENFSLSYLRHLFMSKEIMALQLASIHNTGFYLRLMKNIREAIKENRFLKFKKEFIEKYTSKLR
jgi:queuine tRNA-ribosyltransferase